MLKHVRLVPKIVGMLALLGACGIGGAVVSGIQLQKIDGNYSKMLESEQQGALYTVRANRALQTFRATTAEVIFSKDPEQLKDLTAQNDRAQTDIKAFFDKVLAAMPQDEGLKKLRTDAERVIADICAPIAKRGAQTTDDAMVAAVAVDYYSKCQPQIVALTKTFANIPPVSSMAPAPSRPSSRIRRAPRPSG